MSNRLHHDVGLATPSHIVEVFQRILATLAAYDAQREMEERRLRPGKQ